MADCLTVRKIGNSLGVIIPKSELDGLGVGEGGKLFMVRTPDGIRLVPNNPDFAKVMDETRKYMRKHRDALHELSK